MDGQDFSLICSVEAWLPRPLGRLMLEDQARAQQDAGQGLERSRIHTSKTKWQTIAQRLKRANDRVCQGVCILGGYRSMIGTGGWAGGVLSKPKLHQTEQGYESLIENQKNFLLRSLRPIQIMTSLGGWTGPVCSACYAIDRGTAWLVCE